MSHQQDSHVSLTQIETFGVERIPDHERCATPFDLFRMIFGGANTFATCMLGAFPVLFGLSFWAGAASIVIGVLLGSIILSPVSLLGPINGTNNAVSSGAHFGVHGRVVGSFLALLVAIAFFSIGVWSAGDALLGALHRMIGLPESDWVLATIYAFFALLVLVICIYGFQFMLWVNKIAVWSATILFFVGIFAFKDTFNADFAGTVSLVHPDTFWPAFIGSTLLAMSNPISFGASIGDWARYIPDTTPKYRIIGATILAQLATLSPFLFGLATACIVAEHAPQYMADNNYIGGLLAVAPGWYFLPLAMIAFIGGFSTGTASLYGVGLDMSSLVPNIFTRAKATLVIGLVAVAFIFVGRFGFNLVQSVSTFAVLIVTCTTPWMVVLGLGLIVRRGFYHADDLQVFTRGLRGGAYWFHNGWNWRGLGAWIPSAIIGLCFVNIPGQFVGPLAGLAGDIDISLPVSLLLSAALYWTLLMFFPEPSVVYGPKGPFGLPSPDVLSPNAQKTIMRHIGR
ncbi:MULTISPECIES: purine-cytosine permease family protein [Pseudomonas]|uniref:Cytosine permease n=1 Tax=Pseudomonas kurunegalensis TaxID=485880 RepID=A0ACC5UQ76_9PSED|nr:MULTISPECIES: cytosine permease [Pseudomonas]MBC3489430.1 cytosine permease [Pseudomonas taiwanensis]MBV4516606.1 cytosine permease [Pseudomonas kurunegalensis]QXI32064.1 cytosine permease [Pseudomonas promysalinigenes]